MSSLKKIFAMTLVMVMVLALGACSDIPRTRDAQWSYKTELEEYSAGVYIYALYSAYEQAYSIVSENQGNEFDSTKSILDINSTFDETGKVYLCKDWVKNEADKIVRNIAALDMEINKYGIELDAEIVASARKQAKNDWVLGYYYDYSPEYSVPVKDILEPYGISFDSYFAASGNLANVKQMAIFNHFYNKGGIKEVPESELKAYFEKEYTSYSYFTVNFFTTTEDESGVATTVPFTETEINNMKSVLKSYYNLALKDVSIDNIAKTYMDYAGLKTNPLTGNTEILENSTTLPSEVAVVLAEMEEGTAKVIYTGKEDSQIAYFMYKNPISKASDEYLKDETNYTQILTKLKGDEFVDYLLEITDTVQCQVNSAYVDEFDPKMFEGLLV